MWIPGKPRDTAYGVVFGDKGGGGSSSPSTTTTTQTSEPWAEQKPYLIQGFQGAQNLYNQGGPSYFPGQTLAPAAPQTQQAIDLGTQRALNGSPVMQGADQVAQNTLSGQYMMPGSNPFLDATYNHAANMLESSSRSAWGNQDTVPGSGGMQQAALANAQGNLANQLYGGNYDAERQRQQQTMALSPTLANQDYTDIGQLANIGDTSRSLAQQGINDNINRYNYQQNQPYLNLQNYMQMISGNYGGTNTVTQPYYGSSVGGALAGGALGAGAGYGIGSLFGYGGTGAGIGALGGGLLGGMR